MMWSLGQKPNAMVEVGLDKTNPVPVPMFAILAEKGQQWLILHHYISMVFTTSLDAPKTQPESGKGKNESPKEQSIN